jgi:hypothetical protein
MNLLSHFRASLQLREAVKRADAAHAATGDRYFVIPSPKADRQLYIFDRATFRAFKQKHYIQNRASVLDLVNESFYHTACRGGQGALSAADIAAKRENFFRWWADATRLRRQRRREQYGLRARVGRLRRLWTEHLTAHAA